MNKRKIISVFLVICLVTLSLSATFGADVNTSDVNAKAQALNKLGMLAGDGNGNYNLSSRLKRSEAATFIVRLMGKSDYVLENKDIYIDTGFSDVKTTDWYASYVGYCVQNEIINGLGQGKFGPNGDITEKAFLTLTLKVLGYTTDDFGWSDVYQKAYEVGLVTDANYMYKTEDNKNYTRAQVVEIMYTALGLKMKDSDTTLIEKLISDGAVDTQQAVDTGFVADELKTAITEITTSGEQWITVKFNEAVKPILESDISIYEKERKAKLNFTIIEQTETEMKLKTDTQKPGIEYVLTIASITDSGNITVKSISSGFNGYANIGISSDFFKISKIVQRSSNEIEVYFTHPVNINAEQPEFYSVFQGETSLLEGSKNSMSVNVIEGMPNAVVLNTRAFTFQPDIDYTIKIKGSLISAYGTNLGLEAGDQISFIAKSVQTEPFKLAGITALNSKTVQLDFNKPINKSIAENIYAYKIADLASGVQVQIVNAVTADNTYGSDCSVILTVASDMDSKKAYSLILSYVMDATKQSTIEEQQFSFNPSVQTSADLKITAVVPIDLNTIKVTFDKNIDQVSAEDISNYYVICIDNASYNLRPIKAVFSQDDPRSIRLFIDSAKPLIAGYTYKVNVSTNFKDFTGIKISIPLEYNFIAINVAKTRLEISKAVFIASDTVKISFSKDITLDSPNILTSNYYIQVINDESEKRVPLSINYIDKNTIVLKFDKIDFTKQYYFKYRQLKDITGEMYTGDQINTAIIQGQ